MTPDSLIGVFSLCNRWKTMLLQLSGKVLPPPPALPGGSCERANVAELLVIDGAAGRSLATMFQGFLGFSEVL